MKKKSPLIYCMLLTYFLIIISLFNCKPKDNTNRLLEQALKNKDYATAAFA